MNIVVTGGAGYVWINYNMTYKCFLGGDRFQSAQYKLFFVSIMYVVFMLQCSYIFGKNKIS